MAETREILQEHLEEKERDFHFLQPINLSKPADLERLNAKMSKYHKMRIDNRNYDMEKMSENYLNLVKAVDLVVSKMGKTQSWEGININAQHVDHFKLAQYQQILKNNELKKEQSERLKNELILHHPSDLVSQVRKQIFFNNTWVESV